MLPETYVKLLDEPNLESMRVGRGEFQNYSNCGERKIMDD